MKKLIYACIGIFLLASCSSVRVATDYDPNTDFNQYQSYAFYKPGIDAAEISDLDKKRILRAIENELSIRGFTKSSTPDFLVNITTEATERVDVYNNWGWNAGFGWGWGWGWGPGFYGNNVSTRTEGTLYIDFLDEKKKELFWQGIGTAPLRSGPEAKTERINEIVKKILERFPPGEQR